MKRVLMFPSISENKKTSKRPISRRRRYNNAATRTYFNRELYVATDNDQTHKVKYNNKYKLIPPNLLLLRQNHPRLAKEIHRTIETAAVPRLPPIYTSTDNLSLQLMNNNNVCVKDDIQMTSYDKCKAWLEKYVNDIPMNESPLQKTEGEI